MSDIGQRFLDHHLRFRPVDGSFMGRRECDSRLPRADRSVLADESRAIAALRADAQAAAQGGAGERLDRRMALAELSLAALTNEVRPRLANPAWYSGEALFSIVSLLLPQAVPLDAAAVTARLTALPDFLADARARLREAGAAPAGWSARATQEATLFARFLTAELGTVTGALAMWDMPARRAAGALGEFAAALGALADREAAAGADYLEHVMCDLHGLSGSAVQMAAEARAAFDRLGEELTEDAARLTPGRTWVQAIDALSLTAPAVEGVLDAYRAWHARSMALADAADLLTPATDYGLDYRWMEPPLRALAAESYFLFYRCPPALRPGNGSVYWVAPPAADIAAYLRSQNHAVLKTTHTVHHGSIGHHTQNARARAAPGILGRIAGTDCASGIALLSAGTMVEGWACYAEELLREAGGFYDASELLLLKQNERRNAASVLVDINLHTGTWSAAEAARFYREEAGFPAQRVAAEVVRNSMFPGSRLMYRAGVEAIRTLRKTARRGDRHFHDTLLGYGHVPVAFAADEMARAEGPVSAAGADPRG